MLTEEQIKERSKGIGASEASAVLGINPWKTAYQVWEDKTGLSTGVQEETDSMAYGKLMEPVLRQWYSNKTGRIVTVPEMGLAHAKHPFILASPDGITNDRRNLEIKTSRSAQGWGEPGSDEIPPYYMVQVQQQLMVVRLEVSDVVVSIAGAMPEIYTVQADKELQEMIEEEDVAFWRLVQDRIPPEPVSLADILSMFGRISKSVSVVADENTRQTIAKLKDVRRIIKDYEAIEEECKTAIMKAMGEADTLIDGESPLITWKLSKPSMRFDAKAFQAADPETYNKYLKASEPSRRFLIK